MSTDPSTRDLVMNYYDKWASQDREGARKLLADDLRFRSAQDHFEDADSFLATCWGLSEGLQSVTAKHEAADEYAAFFVLEWKMADGHGFLSAEYAKVANGLITDIVVLQAGPDLAHLLEGPRPHA